MGRGEGDGQQRETWGWSPLLPSPALLATLPAEPAKQMQGAGQAWVLVHVFLWELKQTRVIQQQAFSRNYCVRYGWSSLFTGSISASSPTCWHLFVTPKLTRQVLLQSFAVVHGEVKYCVPPHCMLPAKFKQRPPCFSPDASKETSFLCSTQCHVFCIFVFLLVVLLFKMTLKHNTEIPPTACGYKKAVTFLTELQKLWVCTCHHALGHELGINESIMYVR